MLRKLVTCLVCAAVCQLPATGSLPIDYRNEIEQVDEFPIAMDSLEEFIQSYYTLLDSDEYLSDFSFIKQNKNTIHNSDPHLADFLRKLMELRSGLRDRITVYQFGDSHIKPGFLSTTARSSLKKYFEASETGSFPRFDYQFSGVIGASFLNQVGNSRIFDRCRELKPDLIIISLGTNDAQGSYVADRFRRELRDFMAKLEPCRGETPILFTLPPDSHKRGKHNADLDKVRAEIVDFAKAGGHAWWNLGEVMGGKGSVVKWRSRDFASQDLIHFSPKGYMLQGQLLYHAIMKAYLSYAGTDK